MPENLFQPLTVHQELTHMQSYQSQKHTPFTTTTDSLSFPCPSVAPSVLSNLSLNWFPSLALALAVFILRLRVKGDGEYHRRV